MVNFNFIKKIKKCILDYMIMIHHSKKLSNRKKIKPVTYVRARARVFDEFFSKMAAKKVKKNPKNFFFLFIWPKIHIYTKNEVFRYKTTKKTIWDCTLPLIVLKGISCYIFTCLCVILLKVWLFGRLNSSKHTKL